jgi:hypothetical protein
MGRAKSPTLRGLSFLKAPGGVEVRPVTVLRTDRAPTSPSTESPPNRCQLRAIVEGALSQSRLTPARYRPMAVFCH